MDDNTIADLAYLRDYAQYLLDQGFSHDSSKGIVIRMKDLIDGIVHRHVPVEQRPRYWSVKS